MKTYNFYDVKLKKKVEVEVVDKEKYGTDEKPRYALKGKTEDGRTLTTFVNYDTYSKF